jgi:serine/threonine-protein kinase RsbW
MSIAIRVNWSIGASRDTLSSDLEINTTNRLSEIPGVLDAVDSFFDAIHQDGPARFDVSLALEELFTNIVRYAYPEGETHSIAVTLSVENGVISCKVVDSGRAFDPLSQPEPDIGAGIDEREIGGLGVHIVRQTMQEVRYDQIDGQNVLWMKRALDAAAP